MSIHQDYSKRHLCPHIRCLLGGEYLPLLVPGNVLLQHTVDAGLVAGAIFFEKFQHVRSYPDMDGNLSRVRFLHIHINGTHNVAAIRRTKKAIRKAFENSLAGKGSNLVEVVSNCNSGWKMTFWTRTDPRARALRNC